MEAVDTKGIQEVVEQFVKEKGGREVDRDEIRKEQKIREEEEREEDCDFTNQSSREFTISEGLGSVE